MTEPVTAAVAANVSFLGAGAAGTAVTIFGINTGMNPSLTLVGFIGSCCAMVLLNTVPGSADTLKDLIRLTWRRMFVAMASACTAAYVTPALLESLREPSQASIIGAAFIVGGSAQYVLAGVMRKFSREHIGDVAKKDGQQ